MGKPKRRNSIVKKLTVFLSAVLALECVLFTGFILFGGTAERLAQNAMDILTERTQNRKNYMESEMLQRWSNLAKLQSDTGQIVSAFLEAEDMVPGQLVPDDPRTVRLLGELAAPLISLMRGNTVTGAFVILSGEHGGWPAPEGESYYMAGLHIRDLEPASNPSDNSDLLLERGSSELVRGLNIPMDIGWSPAFTVAAGEDSFYEPLRAAHYDGISEVTDMGYWSGAHTLDGDEVPIVTYSQPLLDAAGAPYGVIGVELTVDYLRGLMPYGELHADKTAAYLLALSTEDGAPGTYKEVAASGPMIRRTFGAAPTYRFSDEPTYHDVYSVASEPHNLSEDVYASIQTFKLYNSNTPFAGQHWVLIGLMEKSELLAFSHSVSSGVLGISLACLILGTLLSILAGMWFTRPIRTLALTVRTIDPASQIRLPPTNISEIDELSSSIETMSRAVAEASSRLSKITEIAGIPLAAFQFDPGAAHPYYTKEFFALIGREEPSEPLGVQAFILLLDGLAQYIEEGAPQDATILYKLPVGDLGYRWLRQQTVHDGSSVLGVLLDVTDEILEKRRIEYERDYDPLTNLLNRRSFQARLARIQKHPEEIKVGAMLMMDLDNLKFLNDTYGHECGDEYIRCAADVLRNFTVYGGVASRISGDEFYLFLSGHDSRESLQALISQLSGRMAASSILLPDGQPHRLRASVGIAWYPEDSTSLSELVRYSDFAMYEAKNATKGSLKDFDIHSYERDSYLLYSREELNRILDERAISYAFQPIVDCRTGAVLGYEALMRPQSSSLPSPLELLRIARAQSKLPQIERLTWFCAMEAFAALPRKGADTLVFINSIPSQSLSEKDLKEFDRSFGAYLGRIVLELTENDELSDDATQQKKARSKETGMRIAMDDFGTGYSNDSLLLNVEPDFVKVDMSIVRGIDSDRNRKALFQNLTSLCRDMHVKVIAEGVETLEELRAVILLGADYIQGYYTGKPTHSPAPIAPEVLDAIRTAQSPETEKDAAG